MTYEVLRNHIQTAAANKETHYLLHCAGNDIREAHNAKQITDEQFKELLHLKVVGAVAATATA